MGFENLRLIQHMYSSKMICAAFKNGKKHVLLTGTFGICLRVFVFPSSMDIRICLFAIVVKNFELLQNFIRLRAPEVYAAIQLYA